MASKTLIILFLGTVVYPLHAGSQVLSTSYPDVKDTAVQIDSIFGFAAQQGSLPFRIKIRNNSGKDRIWKVTLREGSYGRTLSTEWSGSFAVENGSEVIHYVTLPFPPGFASYVYRNLEATFSSPGLKPLSRSHGYQLNDGFPALAMSRALSTRSLAKLSDNLEKKSSGIQRFADPFNPGLLPDNWKAYTGLDALLIDLRSWQELNSAPKRAILQWVRLGGRLHLFASTKDFPGFKLNELQVPDLLVNSSRPQSGKLSLGEIELKRWDGVELSEGVSRPYERMSRWSNHLENDFQKKWTLAEKLGTRPFNSILIFGILLAFAILVAPVNLFYLAGKGRRHRLFITTPIISIAACLIIVLMIFIGDGLGGKGYRIAFVDLQSGENERRFYVSQEQISRTGVIVNTGFESDQDLLIEPVKLEQSPFSALDHGSGRTTDFLFSNQQFRGGFFRSRSQQGFSVRSVEATRGRIEPSGESGQGLGSSLVSSLPSAITQFYYRDANGETWKSASSDQVPSGGTIELTSVSEEEYRDFVAQQLTHFSNSRKNQIRSLRAEKSRFFALPSDPDSYLIETHSQIRWGDDYVLLSGNVETTPSAPAP